jgi:deoxyribose-phosphate aldolase
LAKLAECRFAVEHGAREIDLVMPIWAALEGEWDVVEAEIAQVMEATPGVVRKVIVEIGLIGEERLAPLCAIMNRLRPEFVKTGTGYARPVTAADVGALRARLDAGIGIKAAGGIRTREQAERLIAAGATRIGTSQARTLLGAASG